MHQGLGFPQWRPALALWVMETLGGKPVAIQRTRGKRTQKALDARWCLERNVAANEKRARGRVFA